MAYRDKPSTKVDLTSLTFSDLARISIALAAAGATFFLVFHALAWLVGMPGPYLWFGSDDRWTDIVAAVFSIAVGFAIWNLFCSFLLRLFFLLRAPFTELDEPKL